MDRRSFVKSLAVLPVVGRAAASALLADSPPVGDDITAKRIPRWRGFNLQGRFPDPDQPLLGHAYEEFDFATMAEWRFDFARLPLSYWVWGSRDNWNVVREEPLKEIDRAVDLGKQY